MPILTEARSWRREPKARARLVPDRLKPEEIANVRRALLFLRARHGGTEKLAEALGVGPKTLATMLSKNGKPGAGLALRAARLAAALVEDVLRGAYPIAGSCPHCGRSESEKTLT
jgi:ParB-like chromosome segregation protein Spo0J